MSDALSPLRHAYGMKVPQPSNRMNAALGAPGRIEVELIQQGRALLEAAPKQAPSSSVLDAVTAFAVEQQHERTVRNDAVAAVYGERDTDIDESLLAVELNVLRQGKQLVETWSAKTTNSPTDATLLSIVSQAASATRLAPRPELVVDDAALRPLAVAYGLPLAAGAKIGPSAETNLLVSTRAAVESLPRQAPKQSVTDAILARAAASASPTEQEAAARTAARSAPDRAAAVAPTRRHRTGLIAGITSVAGALVLALVLWPSGANGPLDAAGPAPSANGTAGSMAAAQEPSGRSPDLMAEAEAAPFGGSADAGPANVQQAPPAEMPLRRGGPSDLGEVVAPASAPLAASPVRREGAPQITPRALERAPQLESRAASVADMAEAAPRPRATAPAPDWDMPTDHRVVSLRLNELKRANTGIRWDAPAEAFGAPKTVDRSSASPLIRVVREGAAPARARLLWDSIPRN